MKASRITLTVLYALMVSFTPFQESSWWLSTHTSSFTSMEMQSFMPTVDRTWEIWTLTSSLWQRRLTNRWPGLSITQLNVLAVLPSSLDMIGQVTLRASPPGFQLSSHATSVITSRKAWGGGKDAFFFFNNLLFF